METYLKDLGKVSISIGGAWRIDNEYEKLTLVLDETTKTSYISIKHVPKNTQLINTEYWFNLGAFKYGSDNIINLSYINSDDNYVVYTLQQALEAVNEECRRPGVILTFYEMTNDISKTPNWSLYQFNSLDVSKWNDTAYWVPIYYNRQKFVGWFDTEEILKTNLANPFIGSYAFVGIDLDTSVIYKCKETGTWVATEELARDFLEINITGNVTINEDGHWVVEGIDTGISAVGVTAATAETTILEPRQNPSVDVIIEDIKEDLSRSLHFNFKLPKPVDAKITGVTANIQSIANSQPAECSVIKTGEADNTKLEFNFKIPEGKPAGFGTLTADVQIIEEGEEPSVIINKSGPNTAINLNFLFKLPSNGGQTGSYKTLTIQPTPEDATVTIDNVQRNSITVITGTTINWKVEKEGYITQQGSKDVTEDENMSIVLVELKPTNITDVQYVIESDSEIQNVTQIPSTGGVVKFKASGTVFYNDGSSKSESLNFGTYEASAPLTVSINTIGDITSVTFVPNDSFASNYLTTIRFKYNDGSQDKTVDIFTGTVLKKEEILEVSPIELEFDALGETKTITITSNSSWTIE